MIELNLKALATFFKSQEMPCQVIKATEKVPFDFLFVSIDETEGGKHPLLQIRLSKQTMEADEGFEEYPVNPKGYMHLQFTMTVPIKLKDEAIVDLFRLILVINRTAILPGFVFSEPDKMVYYHYAMIVAGDAIDPYVLISAIGNITLFYQTFEKYIVEVASGVKTFEQVFLELKKVAETQKLPEES